MREIIFLNGKFLSKKEACISIQAQGFQYGWGVFESMRAYKGEIVYLKRHLERAKISARAIGLTIPYDESKLKKFILEAARLNGFQDAYIKLIFSKSEARVDTIILVKEYFPYSAKRYKTGLRACVSSLRQNELSFLAQHKTNNYLFYQLAYLEAKNKGFDEAIILNSRGYIAEGSRTNIFLIRDNEIFTPSLECGCLNGITRRVIFDLAKRRNININEVKLALADLYNSQEAFLTNSLIGVIPLASIEKKMFRGRRNNYSLSDIFIKGYKSLLKI
ncbi:MAG: hypothetical protein DRP74_02805 [Candidatus Omnitrophota bacterium]|nr:MAG: hypothetical protein DRP74_02805 [Candidatus Omnitrophota bacterium]